MSKERGRGPTLHIEWAPGRVQALDTATGRKASGASLDDLSGITRGHKEAQVGIARHLVFQKLVPLPKADPEDLRRILGVQVGQLFPLPADQLAFDFFQTSERTEEGYLTLVAAVRAEDLRLLRSELNRAGITANRIVPVALGAPAVAAKAGRRDALIAEPYGDGYTLDVVQNGIVRLSRTTPADTDLAREAQRTLAAVADAGDLPIIMAGSGETTGAFANAAGERSSALELLQDAPAGFTLELAEERAREIAQRVSRANRTAFIFALGAVALAAFVWSGYSDAQAQVTRSKGKWSAQQSKLRSILQTEGAKAQEATARETVLKTAFSTAQPISDIAAVASDSLPKSTWITGMNLERGKPVQIRGTATDPDDVARYLKSLGDTGRFRDVRLVVANSGRINSTAIVQFNLTATAIGNLPMPVPQKAAPRRASAASKTGTAAAGASGTAAAGTAQ